MTYVHILVAVRLSVRKHNHNTTTNGVKINRSEIICISMAHSHTFTKNAINIRLAAAVCAAIACRRKACNLDMMAYASFTHLHRNADRICARARALLSCFCFVFVPV